MVTPIEGTQLVLKGIRAAMRRRAKGDAADAYTRACAALIEHIFSPEDGPVRKRSGTDWDGLSKFLRSKSTTGLFADHDAAILESRVEALKRIYTLGSPRFEDTVVLLLGFMEEELRRSKRFDEKDRWTTRVEHARGQLSVLKDTGAILRDTGEIKGGVEALHAKFDELVESGEPDRGRSPVVLTLQIPGADEYRVDREELSQLSDRLKTAGVAGITGGSGTGKSLLAIRYARDHFDDDRRIYMSMDSGSRESRLQALASRVGVRLPDEYEYVEAAREVAAALGRFPGVVVFDNVVDAADVRPVMPVAPEATKVIVTSTNDAVIRSLGDGDPVRLGDFSIEQARECFAHPDRLGPESAAEQRADIDRLSEMLGHHPLAVDVAAAVISSKSFRVRDWVDRYPDAEAALPELAIDPIGEGDVSASEARTRRIVGAVLSLALLDLPETAGLLLAALSRFDAGSGGHQSLVESVADVDSENGASLEWQELVNRSLVRDLGESVVPGRRFGMHRLMRVVVWASAGPEHRSGVEDRYLGVMAAVPRQYQRLLSANEYTIASRAFGEESASLEALSSALAKDRRRNNRFRQMRAEFASNVAGFAISRWPPNVTRALLERGLRDAKDCGSDHLLASMLAVLGDLEVRQDNLGKARSRYEEAVPIYRGIGNIEARLGEANTLQALGEVEIRQNNLGEARSQYEVAVLMYKQIADHLGVANTLQALGDLAVREEHLGEARARYDEALPIFREIEDRLGEANTLKALGGLEVREDHLGEARARYDEALPLYRKIESRLGEANTLCALGDLELRQANLGEAHIKYEEAVSVQREIEDRLGEANTLRALGDLGFRQDKLGEARERYEEALFICRDIEDRLSEANTLQALGKLEAREGNLGEARVRCEASLLIYREIESRLGEANTLQALGDLERGQANLIEARARYTEALSIYRDIETPSGEANSLVGLATSMPKEAGIDDVVELFEQAAYIHQLVGDPMGLRSAHGSRGNFLLGMGEPRLSILAFDASLKALPMDSDRHGFALAMRGTVQAMSAIGSFPGTVAALRVLAEMGDEDAGKNSGEMLDDARKEADDPAGIDELVRLLDQNATGVVAAAADKVRVEIEGESSEED